MLLGLLAAFCFSSTFVLNRWMLVEQGGHWYWTAALRYYFTFAILTLLLAIRRPAELRESAVEFAKAPTFWMITGGVGFAGFYLLLSFAGAVAAGWAVAATWQLTVVASPIVFSLMGFRIPTRGYFFAVLVVGGVFLINSQHSTSLGALPGEALLAVAVAAVFYPFGNTLAEMSIDDEPHRLWRVFSVPRSSRVLKTTLNRLWVMVCGSLPALVAIGLIVDCGWPTHSQLYATAIVALLTGVMGTGLFLYARQSARSPVAKAAVDATQASEVPFALLVEVLFLSTAFPSFWQWLGMVLVLLGLGSYFLSIGAKE